MEYQDVITKRRMVRHYTAESVPTEVLVEILNLGTRAPSAGFSQGWDFLVLVGTDTDRYWSVTTDPDRAPDRWLQGMRTAPALILCLSDPDRYYERYAEPDKHGADQTWPINYWDTDVAMAAMIMLGALVDRGWSGCFFGVPAQCWDSVRQEFQIPQNRRLVGVISIGREASSPAKSPSLARGRRQLQDITHWGGFGERSAPGVALP